MLKHLLLLPFALLLAACSLTQYSVSEGEINQYLKERVAFEKQLGIPASCRARSDSMTCKAASAAARPTRSSWMPPASCRWQAPWQPADEDPPLLRARPDYVAEQGAIYLRDLELLSRQDRAGGRGRRPLPCSCPPFNQSLSCSSHRPPVYRLDGSRQNEARIRRRSKPSRWSRADWSSPSN